MRHSLHDYMNVGIVHFMAYPQAESGDDYVRTLSALLEDEFFTAVEIKSAPDEETREQASGLLQSAGMIVGFSAHPVLIRNRANLNALEEEERQRAVDLVKGAVDEAYRFGAANLAFMSGGNVAGPYREQAIERLIESVREICRYARSKGNLEILLEPFDHETDFRCLIGPTELAGEVAYEVRKVDPSFGLLVDLSHLPMLGESPQQALTAARDYLKHAHIGNCFLRDPSHLLYGDKHPRFGYPGSEIDVPQLTEYIRTLMDIGYLAEGKQPTLAFEIKPAPGESSEAIIAQAKRKLRAAWQQV